MTSARAGGARRRALRTLAAGGGAAVLAACGFHLRRPPEFAFRRIALQMPEGSGVAQELKRQLQGNPRVEIVADAARADVVLHSAGETRERIVLNRTGAGEGDDEQINVDLNSVPAA